MVEQPNETGGQTLSEQPLSASAPSNVGIVYILSNPAMEGYIKIGMTSGDSPSDVQKRMRELDGTGVPRPFDCEYAGVVENPKEVEQALHVAFGDFRVRASRKFFEGIVPYRVKAVLRLHQIEDVTPGAIGEGENVVPEKEKPPRKEGFKFAMVDIPIGASLQWADNSQIEAQVADDRTAVIYEGATYALSTLAQKLKQWKRTPSGTPYWLYEGETLQERRERLEEEG